MAQIKGIPRNQSQYATHNWCSHCEEWLSGKPIKCPNCNKWTRKGVHYINGRYNQRDVFRY